MNNTPGKTESFIFNMSVELWEFLFPGASQNIEGSPRKKANRKLSKHEAFFDLINRERLHQCFGDDSFSKVSVNALAQAWGWQRPTVKNFLTNLQNLGVLSFYAESVSTFVKLHNIVGLQALSSVASLSNESTDHSQDT